MGMFTSIMHEGVEYQIKTYGDFCVTYKVGDTVKWWYPKNLPGEVHLGDGAHIAITGPPYKDAIVIIKDHVIHSVVQEDPSKGNIYEQAQKIEKELGLVPFEHSWWTDEQWAKKEARDAESAKRNEEWNKAHAHLTPRERYIAAMSELITGHLGDEGMTRKIFPVAKKEEKT